MHQILNQGGIKSYSFWSNQSTKDLCTNSIISLVSDNSQNITKIQNSANYKQYSIKYPTLNVFHLGIDVPPSDYHIINLTITTSSTSYTYSVNVYCNIPTLPISANLIPLPTSSVGTLVPSYLLQLNTNSTFSLFDCSTSINSKLECSIESTGDPNNYILNLNFILYDLPLDDVPVTITLSGITGTSLQFDIPSLANKKSNTTAEYSYKYPGNGDINVSTVVQPSSSIFNMVFIKNPGSYLFSSFNYGASSSVSPMYGPVLSSLSVDVYVTNLPPSKGQLSTKVCDRQVYTPITSYTNFTVAAPPSFSFTIDTAAQTSSFFTYFYSSPICKKLQIQVGSRAIRSALYPFSLYSKTNTNPNSVDFKFSVPINSSLNYWDAFPNPTLRCGSASGTFVETNYQSRISSTPPYISNFQVIPFTYKSFILKVQIITSGVGFNTLTYGPNNIDLLTYRDLVVGNFFNGTYEKEIFYGRMELQDYFPLSVYDFTANSFSYPQGSVLNVLNQTADFNIINPFNINSISDLIFQNTTMDLTDQSADNILFFKLQPIGNAQIPNNFVPSLQFDFEFADPLIFDGTFNYSNNYATIKFTLPKNLISGTIKYSLYLPFKITWESLYGKFGSSMLLNVTSSSGDQFPPIITSISNVVTGLTIAYNFVINDATNGLDSGWFNVTSNLDDRPYIVTFNQANRVSTNSYSANFTVTNPYKTHTFTIIDAYLRDQSGFYSRMNALNTIDPFLPVYPNNGGMIATIIGSSFTDTSIPSAPAITYMGSGFDSCSPNNRSVALQVIVGDQESGVSKRHAPTIYLSTYGFDVLVFPTTYDGDQDQYRSYFKLNATLPYGFGASSDIFISVYGYADRTYNFGGLTTAELAIGKTYKFSNARSMAPALDQYQPISTNGGYVTVQGHSFGYDISKFTVTVQFTNGSTFSPSSLGLYGGTYFSFFVGPFTDPIYVSVKRDNSISNLLQVVPYPISRPIPIPEPSTTTTTSTSSTSTTGPSTSTTGPSTTGESTSTTGTSTTGESTSTTGTTSTTTSSTTTTGGNPTCPSGCVHGTCIAQDHCKCFENYDGPTCNSIVNPGGNPDPNQNNPSINSTIQDISSVISIIEIRELDSSLSLVQSYPLLNLNWTRFNLTKTNDKNLKFVYTIKLNNSDSTSVNVTIDWFNVATSFSFGSKTLNMAAQTAKYSISLSSYPFGSSLNILQVVMKLGLNAESDDQCSSKQIGGDSKALQWINLKVGDKSLYGRFVEYGVLDGVDMPISNQLLDQTLRPPSTKSSASTVAINVPIYYKNALLDPDFQYLLDKDSKGRSDEICSKSSGLSKEKLIGIIVGCSVFGIGAAVVIAYSIRRNIEQKNLRRSMNYRLGEINS